MQLSPAQRLLGIYGHLNPVDSAGFELQRFHDIPPTDDTDRPACAINAEANRRRNKLQYCACACDLDKFKEIHDTVSKIVIEGDKLLSTSIGIAEARGDGAVDNTVVLADKALYKAKADGRDRAVYFAE